MIPKELHHVTDNSIRSLQSVIQLGHVLGTGHREIGLAAAVAAGHLGHLTDDLTGVQALALSLLAHADSNVGLFVLGRNQ